MTLKETGNILEKYRKIELEIDLMRQQQSDIQKYIHDTKEQDDQITRIKTNAEETLAIEQRDYDDVSAFLSSIIEKKSKNDMHIPYMNHEIHDEFFTNPYENYNSIRKVLFRILIILFIVAAALELASIMFVENDIAKYITMGVSILLPLGLYFMIRNSFLYNIRRLALTQLEAMTEKHDLLVSKVKEEATEKIERIKYQIEQEYEKRTSEKIDEQNALNNKILALRKENSELGIPVNVMQMYDSLKYRDLFVSLLKNAETNDTLIDIWASLKMQEELYKLNSQMYDLSILLVKDKE